MKNIFKIVLLVWALILPQVSSFAWAKQIDSNTFTMDDLKGSGQRIHNDGWYISEVVRKVANNPLTQQGISFQGTMPINNAYFTQNPFEPCLGYPCAITIDSPPFENGNYYMGDMFDSIKKAAYEGFLGFQAAGCEILAFMDTLAEAYGPVEVLKNVRNLDLVHTVNVGAAGSQYLSAARDAHVFNNKYGADSVREIQNANTLETLEQFDDLFSKAPLSWGVQKAQFEEALEKTEAFKGIALLQEQLCQLEQTTFSGNKNFDKVIKALDGKHIKGSQKAAETIIKTIKRTVIKTYDKTHATLTDQASQAFKHLLGTVGKTAIAKIVQPVLRNALEGLEISEACAELSANFLTSPGVSVLLAPLFVFQNSPIINGCMRDTYQFGAVLWNHPRGASGVYNRVESYVSHVYEKGKNYFTGEGIAGRHVVNDLEKTYSDASNYLSSWGSVSAWQRSIDGWTDVDGWESSGRRFATWVVSWFSPDAWKKWADAVFVKKTEK